MNHGKITWTLKIHHGRINANKEHKKGYHNHWRSFHLNVKMVFRCKCYDLAYDKQPKRSQILMVKHQMPYLCYSFSEQLPFYQVYHIPVLFLLLTAWWTCGNQCVERGIVGLHFFNIQYLVSFFPLDIDSACWSSNEHNGNVWIVLFLDWLSYEFLTFLSSSFDRLLIRLFTTQAVLHSTAVSLRENTSRVFKVNGLARSLSVFCTDGESEVPF